MKLILLFIGLALINAQNACCDKNTISVIGAGTVSTDPDIARFTVTATITRSTTALALSAVNDAINRVSQILSIRGLPRENYTTQGISLSPQYSYSNNTAVLSGQRASQSLSVTVGNLQSNRNSLDQIITAVSGINNITLGGLSFQNSNPELAKRMARAAAVSDALAKARQYSTLSGKALRSVKKVVDRNTDQLVPFFSDHKVYWTKVLTSQVPYEKVTTSASVQINWNISF